MVSSSLEGRRVGLLVNWLEGTVVVSVEVTVLVAVLGGEPGLEDTVVEVDALVAGLLWVVVDETVVTGVVSPLQLCLS